MILNCKCILHLFQYFTESHLYNFKYPSLKNKTHQHLYEFWYFFTSLRICLYNLSIYQRASFLETKCSEIVWNSTSLLFVISMSVIVWIACPYPLLICLLVDCFFLCDLKKFFIFWVLIFPKLYLYQYYLQDYSFSFNFIIVLIFIYNYGYIRLKFHQCILCCSHCTCDVIEFHSIILKLSVFFNTCIFNVSGVGF